MVIPISAEYVSWMCHVVKTGLTAIPSLSSQNHGAHITIASVLLCTCAIMHITAFQF